MVFGSTNMHMFNGVLVKMIKLCFPLFGEKLLTVFICKYAHCIRSYSAAQFSSVRLVS